MLPGGLFSSLAILFEDGFSFSATMIFSLSLSTAAGGGILRRGGYVEACVFAGCGDTVFRKLIHDFEKQVRCHSWTCRRLPLVSIPSVWHSMILQKYFFYSSRIGRIDDNRIGDDALFILLQHQEQCNQDNHVSFYYYDSWFDGVSLRRLLFIKLTAAPQIIHLQIQNYKKQKQQEVFYKILRYFACFSIFSQHSLACSSFSSSQQFFPVFEIFVVEEERVVCGGGRRAIFRVAETRQMFFGQILKFTIQKYIHEKL